MARPASRKAKRLCIEVLRRPSDPDAPVPLLNVERLHFRSHIDNRKSVVFWHLTKAKSGSGFLGEYNEVESLSIVRTPENL